MQEGENSLVDTIKFLVEMLAASTIIIYISSKYKVPVDDVIKEIDGKSKYEIKEYFERLASEHSPQG